MNSPKSSVKTASMPPLPDDEGPPKIGGIRASSSRASTSTNPLKISKHESPLASDSIPNLRYHRIPPQLARRQSSSYNHVRNNALVSNSPFKVRTGVKPSKIPTPSRTTPKEDENKPEFCIRRRQSRGLQGLVKEQVVTRSPFLGDKRSNDMTDVPSNPTPLPPVPLPTSRVQSVSEIAGYDGSIPSIPVTPRNPRIADLTGVPSSPSPKSSLVSPKRLHGPRSPSSSPSSEHGIRQRRKTVTFDERCDVLEFDQDEISEEVIDTEDEGDKHGPPEPPSPPISASTDGSFTSYISDQAPPSPGTESQQSMSFEERVTPSPSDSPSRTPHISREEIRRRLMEQRTDDFEVVTDVVSLQVTPDMSFDIVPQSPGVAGVASEYEDPNVPHVGSSPTLPDRVGLAIDAPFNFNEPGVDIGEIHSALDRLMLGVECEFGLNPIIRESIDREIATDGDMSSNTSAVAIDVGNEIQAKSVTWDVDRHQEREKLVQAETTEMTEPMSTDDDMDEPVTPPLDSRCVQGPLTPSKNDVDMPVNALIPHPSNQGDDDTRSLTSRGDHSRADALGTSEFNSSLSMVHDYPQLEISDLPAHSHQDNQCFPGSQLINDSTSISLPLLSFDTPGSKSQTLPSLDVGMLIHAPPHIPQSSSATSTISNDSIPPPVPAKDNRKEQQSNDLTGSPVQQPLIDHGATNSLTTKLGGRPSRRRSLSTGDAEDLGSNQPAAQRRANRLRDNRETNFLDVPLEQATDEYALGHLIDRELKIRKRPTIKDKNRMYRLRECENTIYASADDKVSHTSHAGDVDNGKAWRTVRRPSDMNEYSRQIKEYRAQQKPGKAHGKVFVKVLGVKGLNIPLPRQPTAFTCTLNNGIHFVTTPECQLDKDARIEQEFELIEHSKLEFTLTLTVRRDPHIIAQAKTNATPSTTVPVTPAPPPPSRGVRGFFGVGGSPKKNHKVAIAAAVRATPEPVEDNLARYLKPDGTLARAFVSFKEIAKRCDTRLFETSFPLIGQRTDASTRSAVVNPWSMGEIVLQIFRLPPLPGIPPNHLPQSLEECHRGLRHINWHKVTYHEGVLTQNGGDCRTWRRRLLRVIGSNLVAFNDVTKKATTTINLKKAIAVEDDDRTCSFMKSPSSGVSVRSRDEFDDVYRVERSFRLIFPNDEEISFFADNDEAKARWLEVLRALVGHIPPNPLWAELIWQRQEDMTRGVASTAPQTASPGL